MLAKLAVVLVAVSAITLANAKPHAADGLPAVSLPLTASGGVNMIYTIAAHVGGNFAKTRSRTMELKVSADEELTGDGQRLPDYLFLNLILANILR